MAQRAHKTDPRLRSRRLVIVMIAVLLAALLAMPSAAPVIAALSAIVLLWGVIQHYATAPLHGERTDKGEPALWDDGFGAT